QTTIAAFRKDCCHSAGWARGPTWPQLFAQSPMANWTIAPDKFCTLTAGSTCAFCEGATAMIETLEPSEVRVLGSLIEKEATTPEYYPLSLNALVNACNQKSNRDPVVDYDDEIVLAAIERLRALKLAFIIT